MYTQIFTLSTGLFTAFTKEFVVILKFLLRWFQNGYVSVTRQFGSFLQRFTQDRFGGVSVQAHIRQVSCQVFIIGLGADHGSIIPAKM